MTKSDHLGSLIEDVATALYYTEEYSAASDSSDDVYAWEDTLGGIRAGYRTKALGVIRALSLEYEWGVQTLDHIGETNTTYANETIARIVFEELDDEAPELGPQMIRRIVGSWEEAE